MTDAFQSNENLYPQFSSPGSYSGEAKFPHLFYCVIITQNHSAKKVDRLKERQKQTQGGIYHRERWLLINMLQLYRV